MRMSELKISEHLLVCVRFLRLCFYPNFTDGMSERKMEKRVMSSGFSFSIVMISFWRKIGVEGLSLCEVQ